MNQLKPLREEDSGCTDQSTRDRREVPFAKGTDKVQLTKLADCRVLDTGSVVFFILINFDFMLLVL